MEEMNYLFGILVFGISLVFHKLNKDEQRPF